MGRAPPVFCALRRPAGQVTHGKKPHELPFASCGRAKDVKKWRYAGYTPGPAASRRPRCLYEAKTAGGAGLPGRRDCDSEGLPPSILLVSDGRTATYPDADTPGYRCQDAGMPGRRQDSLGVGQMKRMKKTTKKVKKQMEKFL